MTEDKAQLYVAQNKGKDNLKKQKNKNLDSKSLLGVSLDSQKLLTVSSLLYTYKCTCATFTCEIICGAAGSSDLVAMTTTMTPHPHPNQIYNLHQHCNPRSGTVSSPFSGGAVSRQRGFLERKMKPDEGSETNGVYRCGGRCGGVQRAGAQWRAACRREASVSTPVTPRARCNGEASVAATFAGTPPPHPRCLTVRRMADGGLPPPPSFLPVFLIVL